MAAIPANREPTLPNHISFLMHTHYVSLDPRYRKYSNIQSMQIRRVLPEGVTSLGRVPWLWYLLVD